MQSRKHAQTRPSPVPVAELHEGAGQQYPDPGSGGDYPLELGGCSDGLELYLGDRDRYSGHQLQF